MPSFPSPREQSWTLIHPADRQSCPDQTRPNHLQGPDHASREGRVVATDDWLTMQLFLGQPRQLTQPLIDEPPRNQLFSTLINLTLTPGPVQNVSLWRWHDRKIEWLSPFLPARNEREARHAICKPHTTVEGDSSGFAYSMQPITVQCIIATCTLYWAWHFNTQNVEQWDTNGPWNMLFQSACSNLPRTKTAVCCMLRCAVLCCSELTTDHGGTAETSGFFKTCY